MLFGDSLLASERNEATEKLFSQDVAVEPATKRVKKSSSTTKNDAEEDKAKEEVSSTLVPVDDEVNKRLEKQSGGDDAVKKALLAAARILKINVGGFNPASENKPMQKKKQQPKRPKKRTARSELDRERSTVFVGNVAVGTKAKELKHLFQEKCNADLAEDAPEEERVVVESVRFRGVAFARKGKEPLFVAAHRGSYDLSRDTMNAYVVLNSIKSAEKAVHVMNNVVFKERHLLVDNADNPTKSIKKSVFVGNLPYDAKDEDVRKHFDDCGEVVGVRIIRNKDAHQGKGIAFVAFADRASATAALMKNGSSFGGRKLRVTKCLDESIAKETMEKEKKERKKKEMKAYKEALKRGEHPRPPKSVLEARKAAREWLKTHKKGKKSKKMVNKDRGGKAALPSKKGGDKKNKMKKSKIAGKKKSKK